MFSSIFSNSHNMNGLCSTTLSAFGCTVLALSIPVAMAIALIICLRPKRVLSKYSKRYSQKGQPKVEMSSVEYHPPESIIFPPDGYTQHNSESAVVNDVAVDGWICPAASKRSKSRRGTDRDAENYELAKPVTLSICASNEPAILSLEQRPVLHFQPTGTSRENTSLDRQRSAY